MAIDQFHVVVRVKSVIPPQLGRVFALEICCSEHSGCRLVGPVWLSQIVVHGVQRFARTVTQSLVRLGSSTSRLRVFNTKRAAAADLLPERGFRRSGDVLQRTFPRRSRRGHTGCTGFRLRGRDAATDSAGDGDRGGVDGRSRVRQTFRHIFRYHRRAVVPLQVTVSYHVHSPVFQPFCRRPRTVVDNDSRFGFVLHDDDDG